MAEKKDHLSAGDRQRLSLQGRLSHFDFRRLSYLHAAATAGSIRAGSETLNTNPSALSRQIAKMEEELNTPLIERHGRGIKLTQAGDLLVKYFLEQRSHLERVIDDMFEINELKRGTVSFAIGDGFLRDVMSRPLRTFSDKHPQLQLELDFGTTDTIMRQIIEDEVHLGLVYSPVSAPKIRSHLSHAHPLCVVFHHDHPLSSLKRPVHFRDLVDYDLGFGPGNWAIRQVILAAEDLHKIRLTPRLVANSAYALRLFAEEWGGVVVVPRFAAEPGISRGNLNYLPISDPLLSSTEVHVISRHGRRLSGAAATLLRHLVRELPQLESWQDTLPCAD